MPAEQLLGLSPSIAPDPAASSATGPPTNGGFRLVDNAPDQPASPANTFSLSLNISDCARSKGSSLGEMVTVAIWAASASTTGTPSTSVSYVTFWLAP